MELLIIKLGGSIITDKHRKNHIIRRQLIRQLCTKIAIAAEKYPGGKYIILHGAGSLGHPLAHKYKLDNSPLTTDRLTGMSRVMMNMRRLTETIVEELRGCGLPALPLQTSSLSFKEKDALQIVGNPIVRALLKAGGIPVLGGDVLVTTDANSTIVSADDLAVSFAKSFNAQQILFATNVDGVYEHFPPAKNAKIIAKISRQTLIRLASLATTANETDVTGTMAGKLQKLLPLHNVNVIIFNGTNPDNLELALANKPIGTVIEL